MKIHSIETFGTHEGPGIRLVIFVQGCNFRCAYCHNPDTINIKGGKTISVKEAMKLLEEQRPYFAGGGGLTVSGGEPSLQTKGLIELFTEAKKNNLHTALDTNGSILNDDARQLLSLTDLALIDLKHFDSEHHKKLTGCDNKIVLETIKYREEIKKPFWIRYVLVPGWTDQEDYLKTMAKYLSQFKFLERLEILPYHNLGVHKYKELELEYRLKEVLPATLEDVKKAVSILSKYLPEKIIRY